VTDSIHVPGSTVRRVLAVVRWAVPYVVAGLVTLLGFGSNWIMSRASDTSVGVRVGPAMTAAKAAQSSAHHAATLTDAHELQIVAMWARLVELEAELAVYRDHAKTDPAKRGKLIADARRYYAREYELQIRTRPGNPAEAARLALLAPWAAQ
jgi:hypothetical protein